jgi:predicted RNA-binding Zn ribbon-like protein
LPTITTRRHSISDDSLSPDLPFEYIGGDPALDLVNTVDWTSRGPEQERLTDFDRLTQWAEGAGVLTSAEAGSFRTQARARPQEADAVYRRSLRLRAVLQRLFDSLAKGEAAKDALTDFNQFVGKALERMHVLPVAEGRRRDRKMQLGWESQGERLEAVLWPVVWSAASLLVSEQAGRIRVCGGADCGWIYVDRSRNRLRRWCQMATCGTREKSRRRYERSRRESEEVVRRRPRTSAPSAVPAARNRDRPSAPTR